MIFFQNQATSRCVWILQHQFLKMFDGPLFDENCECEAEVYWYFEEEDEDMQEAGEDYAAIIQLPFKLVETSAEH